jgi:CIC family chloride channel protein
MAPENQKPDSKRVLTAPGDISWGDYWRLLLASGVVGLLASALVWVFNSAIQRFASMTYGRPTEGMPVYWRYLLVILPAAGGLLVALILHYLSNDKPRADMTQLIDSVAEHGGHLEYRNGVVYILASLVGISFGAPVGEDTPAAMIGGHLAGFLGERIQQPRLVQRALVIAGVAAGIASTYFAQLAAVFFALEIVLGGFGGGFFCGASPDRGSHVGPVHFPGTGHAASFC